MRTLTLWQKCVILLGIMGDQAMEFSPIGFAIGVFIGLIPGLVILWLWSR